MQAQEGFLLVIPKSFPAKLWHVVNNPEVDAIVWDSQGEVIVIDKDIIEKQVLSPSEVTPNRCQVFGAITFFSFIRKLYAYGFKKASYPPTIPPNIYRFFHPNFKKDKLELLSLVSRSLPKYRRILPEEKKIEKKDVCVQCDDGEEKKAEGTALRPASAESNLPQQPVELISTVTVEAETTVQPQFHRRHRAAEPFIVYNRIQVSRANYPTCLVPYSTHRRYLTLNTGIPNMVYHPSQFAPMFYWYQQNPMGPGFCSFYQMRYPGNMVQVPPMYPVEPTGYMYPLAPRMLHPSTGVRRSCGVPPLNHPGAAAQHLSFITIDSDTSTPSLQNSPEAVEDVQDKPKEHM